MPGDSRPVDDRLRDGVPDGEALRHQWPVRRGEGRVGLTDERLLVVVGTERESVPYENVSEVTVQTFDWFLALLSVGLVAIGWLQAQSNLPLGAFFALAGLVSLFVTYRKRGKISVTLHTHPKPVVFYLEDTDPFEQAMDEGMRAYEASMDRGRSTSPE